MLYKLGKVMKRGFGGSKLNLVGKYTALHSQINSDEKLLIATN